MKEPQRRKMLNESIGNLDFKEIMRLCMEAEGIKNNTQLSKFLDVPRRTVSNWSRGFVPTKREYIKRLQEGFPSKFESFFGNPNIGSIGTNEVLQDKARDLQAFKNHLFYRDVTMLLISLEPLVYEASAQDREAFRESLGPKWPLLLNLVRALTGEKAREVTFNEKRLERK